MHNKQHNLLYFLCKLLFAKRGELQCLAIPKALFSWAKAQLLYVSGSKLGDSHMILSHTV